MGVEHITAKNLAGSVKKCNFVTPHAPHEYQPEFGAYYDVYCPGIKTAPKKTHEDELWEARQTALKERTEDLAKAMGMPGETSWTRLLSIIQNRTERAAHDVD